MLGKKRQADRRHTAGASTDTRATMRAAADQLADARDATREWEDALTAAGLPEHTWRSEMAYLDQVSSALPPISIGTFLARLDSFASQRGLAWLHGDHYDLELFAKEVNELADIALPLLEAVRRLLKPTVGNRTGHSFARILGQPHVLAPLEDIAKLLEDLAEKEPLLAPLSPEEWQAALNPSTAGMGTLPLPPRAAGQPVAATGDNAPLWPPEAGALATSGLASDTIATIPLNPTALGASSARRWTPARRRLAVVGGVGAVLLLIVVAVSSLQSGPTQPSDAHTAPAHLGMTTTPTATKAVVSGATALPTATPPAQSTTPPAPKPALTCVVHGTTSTLTIKNVATAAFTWRAEPPPSLTVSPAQGSLGAGQSTSVLVSAPHKKAATGTITVITTQGGRSTTSTVSCR